MPEPPWKHPLDLNSALRCPIPGFAGPGARSFVADHAVEECPPPGRRLGIVVRLRYLLRKYCLVVPFQAVAAMVGSVSEAGGLGNIETT